MTFSVSDIISIIALGFSILVFIYSWKNDKRNRKATKTQNELNEKLLANENFQLAESKKAFLAVDLETKGKGEYLIQISNTGKSTARNIEWKIVGNNPNWDFDDNLLKNENFINPNQKKQMYFNAYMNMNSNKCIIKFIYEDDEGKDKEVTKYIEI
jgi:hypothetical protein